MVLRHGTHHHTTRSITAAAGCDALLGLHDLSLLGKERLLSDIYGPNTFGHDGIAALRPQVPMLVGSRSTLHLVTSGTPKTRPKGPVGVAKKKMAGNPLVKGSGKVQTPSSAQTLCSKMASLELVGPKDLPPPPPTKTASKSTGKPRLTTSPGKGERSKASDKPPVPVPSMGRVSHCVGVCVCVCVYVWGSLNTSITHTHTRRAIQAQMKPVSKGARSAPSRCSEEVSWPCSIAS
jgi:hypothetical protein